MFAGVGSWMTGQIEQLPLWGKILVCALAVAGYLISSIQIVKAGECGLLCRLGRPVRDRNTKVRFPGPVFTWIPGLHKVIKADMLDRTVPLDDPDYRCGDFTYRLNASITFAVLPHAVYDSLLTDGNLNARVITICQTGIRRLVQPRIPLNDKAREEIPQQLLKEVKAELATLGVGLKQVYLASDCWSENSVLARALRPGEADHVAAVTGSTQ